MICESFSVHGRMKAGGVWTEATTVTLGFDHPTEIDAEHALTLSITGPSRLTSGRLALELELDDAANLFEKLGEVLRAAERVT